MRLLPWVLYRTFTAKKINTYDKTKLKILHKFNKYYYYRQINLFSLCLFIFFFTKFFVFAM